MSLTMWQQTVVACLRELTDTEQQKRSWLDQDGTEFPSPEEIVCQLFDDSGLDEVLEAGEAFSPECDALLRELSRKVANVRLDQPASSLLEGHAWREIGSMAKVALRKIEKILNGADAPDC